MTSATRPKRRDPEKLFVEAGRFEEKDDVKNAFQCFRAAAQLGHAMSQVSLGNFYADGAGVRKDLPKAAHWYKKAYGNGYRDGALNLAIDRRNEGDTRSAVVWFKRAIAMNSGDALLLWQRYTALENAVSERQWTYYDGPCDSAAII